MGHGVVQLTSQNHHENILDSLHQLRQRGQLSDVTVQVAYEGEVQEFQAHQVMLAASSGYFKNILLSEDAATDKLLLSNMSSADFSTFLDFVYTGKVEVDKDKLGDVQAVAQILDCKELLEICGEAMSFGNSQEPGEIPSAPEDVEKGDLHGAGMVQRSRGKTKSKSVALKRQRSPQNAETEVQSKRLKAKDAVKDQNGKVKQPKNRVDGHKVAQRSLSTKRDVSGDADQVANEDTEEDENRAESKTRPKRRVKRGEESSPETPASDGEDLELEEDVLNDDPEDPLFLSSEEEKEGEARLALKRKSKAQFECEKCQRTFHYERSYLKHIRYDAITLLSWHGVIVLYVTDKF